MIFLRVSLYLLIGLLCFIILSLFPPVEYKLAGFKNANYRLTVEISWLFRGLKFLYIKERAMKPEVSLKILNLNCPGPKGSKAKEEQGQEKRRRKKNNWFPYMKVIFHNDMLARILPFIEKSWFHIKPKKFELKGVIGFEDPYHTALACALLNTFYPLTSGADLETVFDREIVEGSFSMQGRIFPSFVALLLVKFLFSLPLMNIYQHLKEVNSNGSYV